MQFCQEKILNNGNNVIAVECAGGSMRPLIQSGHNVRLSLIKKNIHTGDCVCYCVESHNFLHRVIKIKNEQIYIGSDSASIDSHWIDKSDILGVVISSNPFLHGIAGLFFHHLSQKTFLIGRYFKNILYRQYM